MPCAMPCGRKQIEAKPRIAGSDEGKDGGVLSFDKLGIDMLCVDEADLFKNLWFHTKNARVAGLNNTCSARAGLVAQEPVDFQESRLMASA